MPPTLTRSLPPQTTSSPGRTAAGWVLAGVVALAGAVGAGEVLDPPPTVDLVVVNESARSVTIVVGRGTGPDLPIATIDPGEERPVEQVLDQGRAWTVSYRVAGEVVGGQSISGAELAGQGFRLTVPSGIDE